MRDEEATSVNSVKKRTLKIQHNIQHFASKPGTTEILYFIIKVSTHGKFPKFRFVESQGPEFGFPLYVELPNRFTTWLSKVSAAN